MNKEKTIEEVINEEVILNIAVDYYINNYYHFRDFINYIIQNNKKTFTRKEIRENIETFKNISKGTFDTYFNMYLKKGLIKQFAKTGNKVIYQLNFDLNKFVKKLNEILKERKIILKTREF